MLKPQIPANEHNRIETLKSYEILDTLPLKSYDELTYLASQICQTPIALISLVDENRQWFKSKVGLEASETHRDISFCGHAILSDEDLFVVSNAKENNKFKDNPLVLEGPQIGFYAGAPLKAPNGEKLGTLCVIDRNPRTLSKEQEKSLRYLANQVMSLMEVGLTERKNRQILEAQLQLERLTTAAREEVLQATQKYENMMMTMPVGIVFFSGPDHVYKFTNPAHDRILGFRKDLIGRPLRLAVPESYESGLIDLLDFVYRTGESYYAEKAPLEFTQADGSKKSFFLNFAYHPTRNIEGEIDGIVATVTDVTEHMLSDDRQSEILERAKSAETRMQEAVKVAKVGFVEGVFGEEVLYMSETYLEHWGQKAGATPSELLAQILIEDQQKNQQAITKSLQTDGLYESDFRIRRKSDGKLAWIRLQGTFTFDADKKPLRYFGTSLDITKQKQIEMALEEAKKTAENANQAKSVFLANMSHEIRTPLGAILGFSDQMKNTEFSAQQNQEFLDVINRNANHLLRLVDEILDLSKIEAGKIVLEESTFDFSEFIEELKSTMQFRAQSKGLSLNLTNSITLPCHLRTDQTRLQQICNNLIGNAIKFTDNGQIDVDFKIENKKLRLTVIDTGLGIEPDKADKLFEPFQQADLSTTRKYGGSGLGLALTRRLCKALGGDCYLESSKKDSGSTFVAEISAHLAASGQASPGQTDRLPGAQASASVTKAPPTLTAQKLNVLLIEDSKDNQTLFSIILNRLGSHVELAQDGVEALEKVQESSFDLILCDIQMPRMDGYETKRQLDLMGIKTPIYALTAHAMKEERDRCLQAGFKGFLTKPLDKSKLAEVLSQVKIG